MKSVETVGKTVEQAIELALYKLETTRDKVKIQILNEGGLFDKAKVKVMLNKESEQEKTIREFVEALLQKLNVTCTCVVEETPEEFRVEMQGEDAGAVIGKRGDTLNALQVLVNQIVNKQKHGDEYKRVVLDCENYRDRREETLRLLAARMANKAVRSKQTVKLEPMTAAERRIIHTELQNDSRVFTESVGEEPNRYLTIIPKKSTKKEKSTEEDNTRVYND